MSNPLAFDLQGVTLDLSGVDWSEIDVSKLLVKIGLDVVNFLLEEVVPILLKLDGVAQVIVSAVLVPVLKAVKEYLETQLA